MAIGIDMDEQTIKILARFTAVEERWPVGAWICIPLQSGGASWFLMTENSIARLDSEICELEANSRGIFRDV